MANTRVEVSTDSKDLLRTDLAAVEGDVLGTRNYRLAEGKWVSANNEAVIGANLARRLFEEQPALGETVLLGNSLQPFTISGVLEPRPLHLTDFDFDRNNAVYISWSSHKSVMPTDQFSPRVFFRAVTPTAVKPAADTMRYQLKDSNPQAEQLIIRNPREGLEKTKHLTEALSLFASVMALVAIITACASVAALTLIQAREMQKMLALRRTCGATRREVLTIILREVLTLIVIGAAIGLVVAQIGFQWWARANELSGASSWGMALIGLLSSFAIAVLSAAWPAWHVARQAPAELLD